MSFWLAHLLPTRDDDPRGDLAERSKSKLAEGTLETLRAISNRSVIDFVIRNRIHLLPAAGLIAWAVPPLYGSTPSWNAVPSILLAGFGIYELNRVFDVVEDKINDPGAYAHTSATKALVRRVAIAALCASILLSILFMSYVATIVLSVMVLTGVLYSTPFLRGDRGVIRLKQVSGLKNIVPSLVWPFTTIVYPAMSSPDVRWLALLLAVTGLSWCVFTVEVAWDVRDSHGDQIAGIRTLATAFGPCRALLIPLLGSYCQALVIVLLVGLDNLPKLWLLPALLLVLLPMVAYLWKDSLVGNRDRSHLLVLINILALFVLGLAGTLGA